MSKMGGILVVIVSLLAGFGGGFLYEATLGKSAASTAKSSSSATAAETLAECLKEVWGDDKYAAITANASLATTEDQLISLKCYDES